MLNQALYFPEEGYYAQTYAQFSWICITFLTIDLMGIGFCERMPYKL